MKEAKHVCVLDEDVFWRDTLARCFQERGIRASLIETEDELWGLLSSDPFNVAIVEPRMGDDSIGHIIQALCLRSIPVIVCTGAFYPMQISSFINQSPSAIYLKGNVSSCAITDCTLRLLDGVV